MTSLTAAAIDRAIGRTPLDEYKIISATPDQLHLKSKSSRLNIAIRINTPALGLINQALELAITGGVHRKLPPAAGIGALNALLVNPIGSERVVMDVEAPVIGASLTPYLWQSRCPIEPPVGASDIHAVMLGFRLDPTPTAVALHFDDSTSCIESTPQLSQEDHELCEQAAMWLAMDVAQGAGLMLREWTIQSSIPHRLLHGARAVADEMDRLTQTLSNMAPDRRHELAHALTRFATRNTQISALYGGVFQRQLYEESTRILTEVKRSLSQ